MPALGVSGAVGAGMGNLPVSSTSRTTGRPSRRPSTANARTPSRWSSGRRVRKVRPGRVLDTVAIDMPRPRSVVGEAFERYRAMLVERLRAEVARAFQEQELVEMLDTRIK